MSQQQQLQTGQAMGQTFEQYLPQSVSQVVRQLEQLETDAEWTHAEAMKRGDVTAADKLADIEDIVHLQKKLTVRGSDAAPTVSQCHQQALQQCTQQLQQSQVPGIQDVVQRIQQISQSLTQASQQATQFGQSQGMGSQSQAGGQSRIGGQSQAGGQSQVGGQSQAGGQSQSI